ncbi:MAG TPA: M1 family metallopeptidase, partial [Flavisolibacter sp.]|nr:M1 family metallopeptidase [Flavisolibacter sp.]
MKKHIICIHVGIIFCASFLVAQPLSKKKSFTHQDTLRGSVTPERSWWDVMHYNITVTPDYNTKSITGSNTIEYKVVTDKHSDYIQIDMQKPLKLDEILYNNKPYINYPAKPYYNEGNVWFIPLPKAPVNSSQSITLKYHGTPVEAVRPPWDGGWIWAKDAHGRPWMSVACEGLGASVWYPCKDYLGDEPDNGATLTINIPDTLIAIGNGRLISKKTTNNISSYTWEVKSPINNYDIIPYMGKYVNWSDTMMGEKGKLDLNYWVLEENEQKARKQFNQVKLMLRAFEYWFGPYPFYEDGYKLVESPHLGMEHQSAIAYGNKFENGYLGTDLSGSGWGLKWDYIIVHESGHEWFGNNITDKDAADMWIHEGITDYSETLFIEYYFGKAAADAYTQGLRKKIENDKPIIGIYGVNQEGSGDMYFKGSNMMHTIRQVINNDEKFRQILRGLTKTFYH